MESTSWAGEILKQENRSLIAKIVEQGGDPKFAEQFEAALLWGLYHNMDRFKVASRTQIVEREGPMGRYPSPAKPIMAREILSGRVAPSLKMAEEEVIIEGDTTRKGELALHLITEVNALDGADPATITAFLNTILRVRRSVERTSWNLITWNDKTKEPLQISNLQ